MCQVEGYYFKCAKNFTRNRLIDAGSARLIAKTMIGADNLAFLAFTFAFLQKITTISFTDPNQVFFAFR